MDTNLPSGWKIKVKIREITSLRQWVFDRSATKETLAQARNLVVTKEESVYAVLPLSRKYLCESVPSVVERNNLFQKYRVSQIKGFF